MDELIKTLRAAIRLHQRGEFSQAEDLYREVLEQDPHQSLALHSLGLIAYKQERFDDAEEFVSQAIESDPTTPHLHNSLGVIREALDQPDQAVRAYHEALRLQPNYTDAHKNLAIAYRSLQEYDQAILSFQAALAINAKDVDCHFFLADLLNDRDRYAESVFHYRQAISLDPALAPAHNNLAIALKLQHRYTEARSAQEKALQLKPDSVNFHINLASILQAEGKLEEAITTCKKVIELSPKHPVHHYNLACVQRDQGLLPEAIANNDRAVELDSQFAEAHWNQAICHLLGGQFERGWQEFQWRRQVPHQYQYPHHHSQPLWEGGPFTGRLFLHCEQGMGDAIQFVRYVPRIKEVGGHVILGVWEPLAALLGNFPGVDELLSLSWHTAPDVVCDLQCSLLDLPGIFGTTANHNLPSDAYLVPDAKRAERIKRHIMGPGYKIGIAWQGSPRHANDRNRSTQLATLEPLARLRGVSVYSLQTDAQDMRLSKTMTDLGITDLSDQLTDFADTAAVVASLDLIITVDTALLHLAAAMGKKTWGLLPYSPDWRWMLDREDSPWYPTLKLFRQTAPGDWQGVIERVVQELKTEEGVK